MLSEDELSWIRNVLQDYVPGKISPSYFYKEITEFERNQNRGKVRKELDALRNKMRRYTPEELLLFKNKKERESEGLHDFSGIYIIHNSDKDTYYVGQAVRVFDRAFNHFLENEGNNQVYEDFCLGDTFSISLIPLSITSFLSLNELEDNAIRAYDSIHDGYNKMPGNVMDKYIFRNDEYQQAANLILNKIQGTELFSSLTNDRKRMIYISSLFAELRLPENIHFKLGLLKAIKEYQKAIRKSKK
ncbi:excinuclease ABC subunit C [Bacillus inaquosorum]|uniref:excinuclease ABC subunit C n=1 Tax=Bacillus inaquosorum TaxID=483913 RepID=UPI00227F3B7D|nr:excinuclease ABC subunit C [Bacillus inaquosorum]MCY8083219.1 excinuclease ABC subunit C [Bacillus inaquosorum]MCY8169514.1 excinuclease ABC subunit C [Bacillus inaquosorum]MCY8175855.1 excinuclease ABC subunit C [Bacillus inaquosorum]MCY8359141.1 excinuclease ABC subunit C [Bacillus inaquosorum]